MRTPAFVPLIALTSLVALSCSGSPSPTQPDPATSPSAASLPLAILSRPDALVFGTVQLRVDADTAQVAVNPVRLNQAVGDAYLVGLNELDPFCDCFEVTSVRRTDLPSGDVRLTLGLAFRHPFSLAARPDLFGWDLKAIFVTDVLPTEFDEADVTVDWKTVANPDGYTTEWSSEIGSAHPGLGNDAFPYIILGENPAAVDPFDFRNPAGWNVFPSGGTNTGELELDLSPGQVLDANLFFTAGYQASATRTTRQSPDYTPPRGNMRSPWKIETTITADTLTTSIGSSAEVDIAIWDWQHGQALASDVTSVRVHAPSLFDDPIDVAITGGTGRDTTPLTGQVILPNANGVVGGGSTPALVEVIDELRGNNPGGASGNPGVTKIGDDLQTPVLFDDFRTFQIVRLSVLGGPPNTPPVAGLATTPGMSPAGFLTVGAGTTVVFDGSTSFDPDAPVSPQGDLVLYEYDFEWDGTAGGFSVDESHPTAETVDYLYSAALSTTMGMRVTDGLGLKDTYEVAVTVTPSSGLVLNLDPIVDLVSTPDDRPEWGATLTEEGNGTIAITYIVEYLWLPFPGNWQRASPGYRSTYQGPGWTTGTDVVGGVPSTGAGADPNAAAQWGWHLKSFSNWGAVGTAYLQTATHPVTHLPDTGWNQLVLGYLSPTPGGPPTLCAGFVSTVLTGGDFAVSRVGGMMTSFGDSLDEGGTTPGIVARKGGPNDWCQPTSNWRNNGVPTAIIDSRASQISHWRSTAADVGGGIHLAYRSVDGSRVTYARSPSGDINGYTTTDLVIGAALGEYKDPTVDYDPTAGIYVVEVHELGPSQFQLVYWHSTNTGASFGPMQTIGAPFATQPTDLSVSARQIGTNAVIATGYFLDGVQSVRWSGNGGSSWIDQALSPGPNDYSGEILIDRDTPDFYCVFSHFDGSARSNVQARHGTFVTS